MAPDVVHCTELSVVRRGARRLGGRSIVVVIITVVRRMIDAWSCADAIYLIIDIALRQPARKVGERDARHVGMSRT